MGTELFHADGQTDMTKLILDFVILRSPNNSSVQSLELILHYAVVTFSYENPIERNERCNVGEVNIDI